MTMGKYGATISEQDGKRDQPISISDEEYSKLSTAFNFSSRWKQAVLAALVIAALMIVKLHDGRRVSLDVSFEEIGRKTFLILQLRADDIIFDDEYEAILKYGELHLNETRRMRIESSGIPHDLDLDDYAAIIVGGSPFDISKPSHLKSAIQKKIEADFMSLFDQLVPLDFPFLGICSGCGLLGSYLGTTISTKYQEKVAGKSISLTPQGKIDPLLYGFPNKIRALLAHKEACDAVPRRAVLLITSPSCPVQMFRVGKNMYATQFHPEADSEVFETRIHAYKYNGYFDANEEDHMVEEVRKEETPYAHEILRRFVERYRIP